MSDGIAFIVESKSRKDLYNLAKNFRKLLHLEDCLYFPVVETLEAIGFLIEGASFEILANHEFPANQHGYTNISTKTICLRESVYNGACAGNGRDRMTIMHEIAHLLTLSVCGYKLARSFCTGKIHAYEDPEWQAKCLAGAIMMDEDLIEGMSPSEVSLKCGVSKSAAEYHLSKIKRRDIF